MNAGISGALKRPNYALPLVQVQAAVLWLMMASSWYVKLEPAPYEILFVLTTIVFLAGGMMFNAILVPLVVFLMAYNLGGAFSLTQVAHLPKTIQFTAVSFYMAATSIVFAAIVLRNPNGTLPVFRNGCIIAAIPASIIALIGYFNVAGLGDTLSPLGRAQGTFKDPNVFSTFLILPMMFLIYGFLEGSQRWKLVSAGALLLMVAAEFLAFSRGAWVNTVMSTAIMFSFAFIMSPSLKMRGRIIATAILGVFAVAALLTFILSFQATRDMFIERASLFQPYDSGETGRFGNQLRSLSILIQSPNGMGPFGFGRYFGEDPHNVYVNAFSAYGWLGGLSYLMLIVSTIAVCWRAAFTPSPFQRYTFPVVSVLLATILQGIQIDTDHWRHFYLLLGLAWGLCAVTYLPVPASLHGGTSRS